jgi:hypothetical protein
VSALALRLEPQDVASAAATLAQAIKDNKEPGGLPPLAQGLSAVAARMEPKDAAATLAQAIKDTKDPGALSHLAEGLSAVATRLEGKDAAAVSAQAAATLAQATKDTNEFEMGKLALARGLSWLLSAVPPSELHSRSATAASAVTSVADTGQPLTAFALLLPAAEPPPCRLSTPQLVNLLKTPGFVGEARRVVLDHLGNRYKRHFADQWEFVRFAKEQKLDLDFTSPAQRPE